MTYSASSQFYGIPIAVKGDKLMDEDQRLQMKMIDSALQAGASIAEGAVISEGTYLDVDNDGTGYRVLLNPLAGTSIKAVLKNGLIDSSSTVAWEELSGGNFYYLYLEFTTNLYEDPTAFNTYASLTPLSLDSKKYLFLATYDLTSGFPGTIDTNPFGKKYTADLLNHIIKITNPHGANLTQTNLTITGSLDVGLDINKTINVRQESSTSGAPLFTLYNNDNSQPIFKTLSEFTMSDTRIDTQLSDSSNPTITNGASSIIGGINDNTSSIGTNVANISLNTSHRTGDGSDHSDVALNTSHRTGDGSDHSNVALNDAHRVDLANPHQVDKTQVGLDQVDNTSDLDKPISTATQAVLDEKITRADFYALNELF